jgi:hypothetical protein
MLELDYLHRARNPLAPGLRGQIRWAAARANRCESGEAIARADLRAAGVGAEELEALTGDPTGLPAEAQEVVRFAFKLTLAAESLTDADVARLIDRYGEKQVVAIVLLLAYANFQDRLLLALDPGPEPGGPPPPLDVRFARRLPGTGPVVPPRTRPHGAVAAAAPEAAAGLDWSPLDLAGLRADLDRQRARRPRIRLPEADRTANRWGLVGQAYQPELATAWSACAQAFGEEADQDPVFEQSIFWVVTRTKRCFY